MALNTSLVAYYSLSDANDSAGANNLTNNGSTPFVSGKVGNCADFERGSSQYLSIADNAALSMGDFDFTLVVGVNLESKPGFMGILSKWGTDGNREWYIGYNNTSDRFEFGVSSTGLQTNVVSVAANNLGSPSLATWYQIVAQHDSVNNLISIRVNNGTPNTASHSAGVANAAGAFNIGALNGGSLYDGLADEVLVSKYLLTSGEITDLYNGGSWRDYAYISSGGGAASKAFVFPTRPLRVWKQRR